MLNHSKFAEVLKFTAVSLYVDNPDRGILWNAICVTNCHKSPSPDWPERVVGAYFIDPLPDDSTTVTITAVTGPVFAATWSPLPYNSVNPFVPYRTQLIGARFIEP